MRKNYDHYPEKIRPLSAWEYWGLQILFALPVVGTFALIICALFSSNVNRKNFARSYFCSLLIVLIIALIGALLLFGYLSSIGMTFTELWELILEYFNELPTEVPYP